MVECWTTQDMAELVRLAESGDSFWQMHLGWVYYNGILHSKNINSATIWMNRALQNGCDEVKFEVAKFYYLLNDSKALPILEELTVRDRAYGLYLYGVICDKGKLVSRDPKISIQYWERASKQGHLLSRGELLRHRLNAESWSNKPYLLVQLIKNSIVAGYRIARDDNDPTIKH